MNRSLSIPEWHKLASTGSAPPVRIQLMGISMFPLVRYKKDYVTIIPIEDKPQRGDIVLFYDQKRNLYVVHRVWEVKEDMVLTWGDNCYGPDGWLSADTIWGKAVLIERGKRRIVPNPNKGLKWAVFWHHAGKIYHLWERIKAKIPQRIKTPIKQMLGR